MIKPRYLSVIMFIYILTSISVIIPFPDNPESDRLICPQVVFFALFRDSKNLKVRFCRLSTMQNANINRRHIAVIAQIIS